MLQKTAVILMMAMAFLGCRAAQSVKQAYYPDDTGEAFQKMLVTLQELGWTITTTDKDAGLITAEKKDKRKRKPELETTIVITSKKDGSDIRVSVTKTGVGARRKVRRAAEDIMKQYSR